MIAGKTRGRNNYFKEFGVMAAGFNFPCSIITALPSPYPPTSAFASAAKGVLR
jgi:hypothetical protein